MRYDLVALFDAKAPQLRAEPVTENAAIFDTVYANLSYEQHE